MRALAAKQYIGEDHTGHILRPLDAYIEVEAVYIHKPTIEGSFLQRFHNNYIAKVGGSFLTENTSLHKAKNAIRRHFGIASRKELRWEERSR